MAVPDPIRVKLSSEAGGAVSLTPVVAQDMPVRDLLELIVANTGKNGSRVAEILKRGTLVSGATRFRWQPVECNEAELQPLLASLPEPEPERPLHLPRCARVALIAGSTRIEIAQEAAMRRRLFRRRSFWDAVAALIESAQPEYVTYLYREKADHYRVTLSVEQSARLQEAGLLLAFRGLRAQLTAAPARAIDLFVMRS